MIGLPDSFLKQYNEKHSPHTLFGIISSSVSQGASWATALLDWAKRKEITINGASKTATYTDAFGTDGYTDVGTNIGVSGGTMTCSGATSNADNRAWKLLGSTLSDTAWVIDFDFKYTAVSGTFVHYPLVVTDLQDVIRNPVNDQMGFVFELSGSNNVIKIMDSNNTSLAHSAIEYSITADTQYYIRLIRNNSLKLTMIVYTDSDRTEVINTQTLTLQDAYTGIDTIQHGTASASASGTATWTIDNLNIYNGVTTVENIPSQQTATYTNDFSTDNMVDQDSTKIGINTGTGKLDFDARRTASNHASSWDLGATVSDSAWVMRFKLSPTTITQSNDTCRMYMGLSSLPSSSNSNASHDFIGFHSKINSTTNEFHYMTTNGASLDIEGTTMSTTPSTGDLYIEIIRKTTTTWSIRLTTSSDFTGGEFADNISCSSSTTALQYFWIGNVAVSGTEDARFIGTIDDIELYNNITEVNPATLTDYPLTIKIQGDADLMEKTTETHESNFTADSWVDEGSRVGVNTTTGRMEFDGTLDATNHISVFDLTSVSDTKWTLDFDMTLTTLTESANNVFWIGMSDSVQTVDVSAGQDFIGFRMLGNGTNDIGTIDANGGTIDVSPDDTTGADILSVNRELHLRLQRLSDTAYQLIIYADSARNVIIDTLTGTLGAGLVTGLRYIKLLSYDSVTESGKFIGYINKMRFWDGITNPVTQETATFSDSAFSTGWNQTGTTIVATGGQAVITANPRNAEHRIEKSIGVSLSNDVWVMRFKLNMSAMGVNSAVTVGMVSDGDFFTGSGNDMLGVNIVDWGSGSDMRIRLSKADPTILNGTNSSFSLSTDYWVEIKRTNTTTLSGSVFTADDYSTGETVLTPMTITDTFLPLTNITISSDSSGLAGTCTGIVDDIEIWNGISSPNAEGRKIVFTDNAFAGDAVEYASETVSYDPINGDLEAVVKIPSLATGADTTIQMYYDYTPDANPSYVPEVIPTVSSILEQDFSADESWTHSAKTSISSGALNWQNNATGTNLFLHAYRAIPQLKDDYFDVRFKLDIDVLSGSGGQDQASICWFISDTTADSGYGVGFRISFGNPTYTAIFQAVACVTGTSHNYQTAGTDIAEFAEAPSTGIYYIKIKRTSSTVATVGIYSDSDYTTLVEEETLAITSSYISLDNFMISTRNGSNETTRSVSGTVDDFTIVNNNREQATWNGNYKAVHHLQGNSTDSTVYGNDGTDTAISYEQQNNSVGAGFNGTTSIIGFTTDSSLDDMFDGGGVYSTTFNVKSDGEGSTSRLLDKGALSIKTLNEASGLVRLEFKQAWSGNNGTWQTAVNVSINELHTLDVIYNADSVSNDPVFILDGVKLTVGNGITETLAPTGTRTSDAGVVYNIGNELGITNTVDGFIGEARFSDVTRPSSEAITSYNAEKSDTDMTTVGTENTQ